jgi:transcriptional regulator with XRE-family HTH domain
MLVGISQRRSRSAGTSQQLGVRSVALGAMLRALRTEAGLKGDEAGRCIGASATKICRIEGGVHGVSVADVAGLLGAYGCVGDRWRYILKLAAESEKEGWRQPKRVGEDDWLQTLVDLEAHAERLTVVDPVVVPELLRTPEYHSALLATNEPPGPGAVRGTPGRPARQALFDGARRPLLTVFVDGLGLSRPVGDIDLVRRQLDHLITMVSKPWCVVRVVTDSVALAAATAFEVVRRVDGRQVVVIDTPGAVIYVEEREEIEVYAAKVDYLRQVALDPADSLEFIVALAHELQVGGLPRGERLCDWA